jgi:hypothetical protein
MTDIDLRITVEFTATMIIRCNVIKDEAKAHALALELHEIIGIFRRLYSVRPPYQPELIETMRGLVKIEETDLVLTFWEAAFFPPKGSADRLEIDRFLCEQFDRIGADELFEQYARLCDKINGTNFAEPLRS